MFLGAARSLRPPPNGVLINISELTGARRGSPPPKVVGESSWRARRDRLARIPSLSSSAADTHLCLNYPAPRGALAKQFLFCYTLNFFIKFKFYH